MSAQPLSGEWKERLLLSNRRPPEYFDNVESVTDGPHSSAIRLALTELGLSGVFCVQGVPTVVILVLASYNRDDVINIYGKLWNQGLASVLLVISDNIVRVFSLARVPQADSTNEFDRRCLVQTLDAVTDALALKKFFYSAESGRLWTEHVEYFKPKERIDHVLLENLIESHRTLSKTRLSADSAQALLIQTMFIAYLEDRGIIGPEYFQGALRRQVATFSNVLQTGDGSLLNRLFSSLRNDFNGDLFVAPCSFEAEKPTPQITSAHMAILLRFRTGREEMAKGGQYRFWGYNFKFIPVELISAVYDRFLGEKDDERREKGAYYTPMFLADTVISQLWDSIPPSVKEKGEFFDPACGSGMFLVRTFQRLCDHRRPAQGHHVQALRWDTLLNIVARLRGSDVNGGAVRVAVFSLYIALLEEVSPPDILKLLECGRILPPLWNKTFQCKDFFDIDSKAAKVDVILGNPPWASRKGGKRSSIEWCKTNRLPMPEGEDAWAFSWKGLQHLKPDGILAFLVPAMSFLHNLAPSSCEARTQLIHRSRMLRIINFSDLRFQLFDGAVRSTALLLCTNNNSPETPYRFEYWTPHADVNLKIRRFITLTPGDRKLLNSSTIKNDPLEFKHQLWMRGPEAKLFNYLSRFPKLSSRIQVFASAKRDEDGRHDKWIIGYGFQPAGSGKVYRSQVVGKIPNLPIEAFTPLAISTADLKPWPSGRVFRHGFEAAFQRGPKILISRGVGTAAGRLRAAYTDDALTFRHIIQAITVSKGNEKDAKLLTALLNSRVAVWYAFHGTASFGSERPEVQQRDLLRLPFPTADQLPDPEKAQRAARELVKIVDDALRTVRRPFTLKSDDDDRFRQLDRLAYDYFCLSDEEILLIEDAVEHLIPAVQPSSGTFPDIWKQADRRDRQEYAKTLVSSLREWFDEGASVEARLEAHDADLAVLRLTLNGSDGDVAYEEERDAPVAVSLQRLMEHIHQPLPGNFQLLPDFRVFVGNHLYLIKPMQKRFWLRSSGLADADSIALDLQTSATKEVTGRH